MKVLATCSFTGGVGKTSTCVVMALLDEVRSMRGPA